MAIQVCSEQPDYLPQTSWAKFLRILNIRPDAGRNELKEATEKYRAFYIRKRNVLCLVPPPNRKGMRKLLAKAWGESR